MVFSRPIYIYVSVLGVYSSVGIVTRYGLDGPVMNLREGERVRFSAAVQTVPVVHQPPVRWVPDLFFRGLKRPGSGVDLALHLAPRLKKD